MFLRPYHHFCDDDEIEPNSLTFDEIILCSISRVFRVIVLQKYDRKYMLTEKTTEDKTSFECDVASPPSKSREVAEKVEFQKSCYVTTIFWQ